MCFATKKISFQKYSSRLILNDFWENSNRALMNHAQEQLCPVLFNWLIMGPVSQEKVEEIIQQGNGQGFGEEGKYNKYKSTFSDVHIPIIHVLFLTL